MPLDCISTRRTISALSCAARHFARSVASDESAYVHAYLSALNIAVELHERVISGTRAPHPPPLVPARTILIADPSYAANARRLYTSRHAALIPRRSPNHTAHIACTLVRFGDRSCCGLLVTPNVVVTGARVVGGAGETTVSFGNDPRNPVRRVRARRTLVHPDYDAESGAHDLALLLLEENMPPRWAEPIADAAAIDASTSMRVVWYGRTTETAGLRAAVAETFAVEATAHEPGLKNYVDVPSAPAGDGRNTERARYAPPITAEFIIGKPALDRDGCAIELGSACYVRHGNGWRPVGLALRPLRGSRTPCGDGIVGLRLDRYMPWIRSMPGGRG